MKSFINTKLAVLFVFFAMSLSAAFAQTADSKNTVRVGMAGVKTGAVGEGMNSQELAGAIQNSLDEYLKGSKIELVPLEAKLASALDGEAKERQCAFVLYATVSHKKGGSGGFGKMFSSIAPMMSNVIPMAGGMGGAIAGSVVSTAAATAAGASANVKSKDEITLDIKVNSLVGGAAFAKQYKGKAKSEGQDIISPLIEEAAQALIDAVAK